MTTFPTVVQQAIDYGRALTSVTVCTSDWRGVPGGDAIEVDFIIGIQDDSIELGTVWCPRTDDWTLVGGSWRTFSNQDHSSQLDTWDDVRAFLDRHTANDTAVEAATIG